MKKSVNLIKITSSFASFISLTGIASATSHISYEGIRVNVMDTIWAILAFIAPFFELIIGKYSTSEFFFAKILLLFLLILICKYALDKTPLGQAGEGKFSLFIAIIISILAIRFISDNDLIQGILVPYGTLGVALTTILPFLIFFFFVHQSNVGSFGRKFFWGIFVIIFMILWFAKYSQLGIVSNQIYALILVLAVLLLIFDKSIHSYFSLSELRNYERIRNKKLIREAKKELDDLEEHLAKRRISLKEYKEEKKAIEDYIKELSKE